MISLVRGKTIAEDGLKLEKKKKKLKLLQKTEFARDMNNIQWIVN